MLSGAGSPPLNTLTNSSGNYTLSGFGAGPYTITPSRTGQACSGGPPNGIFSNDASLVAQHVVNIITLSPDQQVAGTVNGLNLPISSFDASLIAQKVVGICNVNSRAGQWIFAPPSVAHPGGVNMQLVENYRAFLIGDVSGDWDPLGPPDRPGESPITGGDVVTASLPAAAALSGSQVLIPVRLDGLRERTVDSLQFDISYDPAVMTPAGATLDGAVDQSLSIVSNMPEPGLLKVAVYGASSVAGDGVYAYLIFNVNGSPGTVSDMKLSGFRFDDGRDPVAVKDGQMSITLRSTARDDGRWRPVHNGWRS